MQDYLGVNWINKETNEIKWYKYRWPSIDHEGQNLNLRQAPGLTLDPLKEEQNTKTGGSSMVDFASGFPHPWGQGLRWIAQVQDHWKCKKGATVFWPLAIDYKVTSCVILWAMYVTTHLVIIWLVSQSVTWIQDIKIGNLSPDKLCAISRFQTSLLAREKLLCFGPFGSSIPWSHFFVFKLILRVILGLFSNIIILQNHQRLIQYREG